MKEEATLLGAAVPRRAVLAAAVAGLGVAPVLGYAMARRASYWWGDANPSLSPAWGAWELEWNDSGYRKAQDSYHWVEEPTPDRRCHVWFELRTTLTSSRYYIFNSTKCIMEGGRVLCWVNHLPGDARDYTRYTGAIPTQDGDCWISGPGIHHLTSYQHGYDPGNGDRPGSSESSVWELKIPIPYWIDAEAGRGGSISPEGRANVAPDGSAAYAIEPSDGYRISDVLVDGASVGARASHTFENVSADHTIKAVFAKNVFTVRFLKGYGDDGVLKTQKVEWGDGATAPKDPTRPGWKFTGWDKGFSRITSDLDVRAKWKPDSSVRYHADGELMYTQGGLTPGSAVAVPRQAVDSCTREGCTPGWTGWFSDAACTRRWGGGKVPAGVLDLYSYNELTLSFAPTEDSSPVQGSFHREPDASSPAATLVPPSRKARFRRRLTLSLPPVCYRDDGDGRFRTYRDEGYFGNPSGAGAAFSSLSPERDATLYLRWTMATEEGVESSRG